VILGDPLSTSYEAAPALLLFSRTQGYTSDFRLGACQIVLGASCLFALSGNPHPYPLATSNPKTRSCF
jgi:hypothetical protein